MVMMLVVMTLVVMMSPAPLVALTIGRDVDRMRRRNVDWRCGGNHDGWNDADIHMHPTSVGWSWEGECYQTEATDYPKRP